jgi:hypothetical protein
MEKELTAVEWFAKQVLSARQLGFISNEKFNELLDQAKKMEKQDKFKEYDEGYDLGLNHGRQIHRGGFRGADGPILK